MPDYSSERLSVERPNARNPMPSNHFAHLKAGLSAADWAPIAQAIEIPVPDDPPGPARPNGIDVA
ncbi:MAG: hypothetical protein ACRER2_12555 [Methylococcales bacterium]